MLLDFTYDKSNDWYLNEWMPKIVHSGQEEWQKEVLLFIREWFSNKIKFEIKTSGTTGTPKIESFPREAFISSAQITINTFDLIKGDLLLMCLPIHFVAGKMMLIRAIVGRMKVLITQPTVNPIKDLLQTVKFAGFTPHQLQTILKNNPGKLNLIEKAIIGGSPVNSELQNQLIDFKTCFFETFGMSETLTHIATKELNGANKSAYFEVLKGFNIQVDKNDLLIIEADHLKNSPLLTSDIVEMIDSKRFKWLGRSIDVINSGGVKIFPAMIEKKIGSKINREFFIGKQSDRILGESCILYIEGEPFNKKKISELHADFKTRLTKYEIPKEIVFKPEFMRNKNGKVIKSEFG